MAFFKNHSKRKGVLSTIVWRSRLISPHRWLRLLEDLWLCLVIQLLTKTYIWVCSMLKFGYYISRYVYIGSANNDRKSLTQVKEVGIYLVSCPDIAKSRTLLCWSHFVPSKERYRPLDAIIQIQNLYQAISLLLQQRESMERMVEASAQEAKAVNPVWVDSCKQALDVRSQERNRVVEHLNQFFNSWNDGMENLYSILTSPANAEQPSCPVCLERLDQDMRGILTTICNHLFHCSCISKWTDSSCPVDVFPAPQIHGSIKRFNFDMDAGGYGSRCC
ncbi:unnamed protein product [Lactuca saligna]|uniref:RING-type domain-containing protein n=1 Tax=Lactuca saligna TaxID=75948 RepID=A0AA35ZU04_LACSI|nr:unnamed protein product [Lactuca saligna]